MITLNLLSPEKKKELAQKKIYDSLRDALYILLLFSTFIAAISLMARLLLKKNFETSIKQNIPLQQKGLELERKVTHLNKTLARIEEIQKNSISYSPTLLTLTQLIPNGITISELTIARDTVSIRGKAKSRDAFLELTSIIEKNPDFENVDYPITNLVQKEDIDFSINFTVRKNKSS